MGVMSWFKNLFNKNKELQLPEGRGKVYRPEYSLQRDDGTYIKIIPVLDREGNQDTKNVEILVNGVKNTRSIAHWLIRKESLEGREETQMADHIYMDISMAEFENMEHAGKHFLANCLLEQGRLQRVIDDEQGYIGGIQYDYRRQGFIKTKYDGVAQALKDEKEKKKCMVEYNKAKQWREELKVTNKSKHFTRDDGTQFDLSPVLDLEGKQVHKQVITELNGIEQIKNVPEWRVSTRFKGEDKFRYETIYMDMLDERFEDMEEEEKRFFANELLGEKRLKRVIVEDCGYVGGIRYNNQTKTFDKVKYDGVIAALKKENHEYWKDSMAHRNR